MKLDQDFGATFSGVLTDEEGRVRALWGSYAEQVGHVTCIFGSSMACLWPSMDAHVADAQFEERFQSMQPGTDPAGNTESNSKHESSAWLPVVLPVRWTGKRGSGVLACPRMCLHHGWSGWWRRMRQALQRRHCRSSKLLLCPVVAMLSQFWQDVAAHGLTVRWECYFRCLCLVWVV